MITAKTVLSSAVRDSHDAEAMNDVVSALTDNPQITPANFLVDMYTTIRDNESLDEIFTQLEGYPNERIAFQTAYGMGFECGVLYAAQVAQKNLTSTTKQ